MLCEKCLHKDVCSLKIGKRNSQFCEHFKDVNEWLKIPCIAMIEQFIGEKGEFSTRCTAHNGKTAVIYRRNNYDGVLIDVTNECYHTDIAKKRIAAIVNENKKNK